MAKIAFQTFGCTLNFSDSEVMMGSLRNAGHEIVDSVSDAELVVVNGCSVKNLAESKFFKAVRDASDAGKKVVVAGCVVSAEKKLADTKLSGHSVVGTKQLGKIVHVVEETLLGNVVQMLGSDKNERLNVPRVRRNSVVGIVPIAEGCLGECAYCKARFARGKLVSYDPSAIVKQVISDVADGCREIWLTSQDCGAYGKDIGTDIVSLVCAVCEVEGDFMIRIGMMNPNFALEYLDDLVDLFKSNKGKLFWFLHIPVQAGSDRILGLMRRKYTVADFVAVCTALRKAMPEFAISTDVICGFPSETEDEFSETLALIERVKPDVINVSRFWARPGTEAASMGGQLTGTETNSRSRKMVELKKKVVLSRNRTWLGWKGSVLVDERGKVGEGESWIGRNYAYKPFGLRGAFSLGQKVDVTAEKAHIYYLECSVL
ncbi:tRNA (N(6)-L-threonylcarbamoyladenosine(37)-C(2))-methylthiotransferase [Candidatus Woesearchaeota archaeon]|nr:tRNA (N(6)-L-threonylcarbamoyladenosine(37)-C(2))-methylthiotransferase [Candidatus Woesearchaeota archaeon]